ncbi:MFS transporter [Patulibacter sp.]|uniref:MFS transporter n=1 Tax=Patulibacter sp. TaxID=1912859 RepID=UPI00271B8F30|nr:MFS transporter [Patulibacter sp.]MDO9410250.1 MFS transporter [Patulibacter sp.]
MKQPTAEREPTSPGRVLLIVAAAVFLVSLDLFIVNIAFPDVEESFPGSSVAALSWVLNGYAIVFAALLVPAGILADRLGRRRIFLVGLGVFVLASAACGVAWSVPSLVAFRVVQAVGAALLMPSSLALLLDAFPPERRAKAIGAWAGIGGAAAALGPPVGGALVSLSWRWVFLVNLPFGIAAIVAGRRALRESRNEQDRRWPDALGTAALVAGVGALCWALVEAPDRGWGSLRTVGLLVVSLVLLAGVVRRSRHVDRAHAPVLDLELFRSRTFAAATLSALLFSVAFAAMLLEGVLLLTGPWGDSVLVAGLSLAPGPLLATVVAITSGRLSARIGQGPTAVLGNVVFALGVTWWLWRQDLEPNFLTGLLPGSVLTGTGVGLLLPAVSTAVASTLAPARLAAGSALLTASRQLGSVLGVALLVAILGSGRDGLGSYQDGWAMMLVACGLGAVAALGIGSAHPVAAPAASPAGPTAVPAEA